jgi:light-harvesting protein B-800-850 alpha chain
MNNAKIWLVVKPTVGVPLFLTAVAVGSFAVHVAVLSNTSWVADFLSGKPLGSGAMASAVLPETNAAKVADLPGGSNEVLITMPDGSTARAVLQMPQTLASN